MSESQLSSLEIYTKMQEWPIYIYHHLSTQYNKYQQISSAFWCHLHQIRLHTAPPPARQDCKANSSLAKVKRARTAVICRFLSDLCRAMASTMVWMPRGSSDKNDDPKREIIRIVWQSRSAWQDSNETMLNWNELSLHIKLENSIC